MGQCASDASGKTLTPSQSADAAKASPQSIDTQKVIPTAVSSAEGQTISSNDNKNNTNGNNGVNASSIVPSIAVSSNSASSLNNESLPPYKPESKEEISELTTSNKATITSVTSSNPTVIVTPATSNTNSVSSPSTTNKEDDEWRLTVKSILCTLLERVLEVVDTEREALINISTQLALPNVIQLFNGKQFELLLRETFVLPSLEPTVPTTNPQYDELRLGLFLSVLRSSTSAAALTSTTITYQPTRPTRQQMAINLVKLCESTQNQLFTAANLTNAAKLQRHLLFFARTFTFATRTDIVNRIEALYENVDEVIAVS